VHRLPLGRVRWLVTNLLVLMMARRVRQSFLALRVFPNTVGTSEIRSIESLELLRCGEFPRRSAAPDGRTPSQDR
jgi:hypothetical protein